MFKIIRKKFLFLIILFILFNYSISSLKFNIPNNREKCFQEEIFSYGTFLIRYDLKGTNSINPKYKQKVLQNIKIFVRDPKGKIIHEINLLEQKGKFAINAEEEGHYYICARYYKVWGVSDLPKDVLLGIKIRSDFIYKKVEDSLKTQDVNNFVEQINSLKYRVITPIDSSKKEIDEEDKMAKAIISTSNLYFTLSIIQMILIIIIAVYQILNTKKFLSNKRLI